MLHWRLILAAIALFLLLGLAWLDLTISTPGVIMLPLAFVAAWMSAGEFVGLYEKATANRLLGYDGPIPIEEQKAIPPITVVQLGSMIVVGFSSVPLVWRINGADWLMPDASWLALGIAMGFVACIASEMFNYDGRDSERGVIATRLARSILALVYSGGLTGFLVLLRALQGPPWGDDGRWGMVAVLSAIAVVKLNDTGAYFAGRWLGRHKITPRLSPGKTWEGTIGGFIVSLLGTWLFLSLFAELLGCYTDQDSLRWWLGTTIYAGLVGLAGVIGDLTVSLLKRDAGVKDSSRWMPGFGGFLDLLDSILLAAPVAYLLWILRIVGP